jgi:hypothetical protein
LFYAAGLKLPYNSSDDWEIGMPPANPKLRVFLCHSSTDKAIVRELYQRLKAEEWVDPWLDEEELLPGQDWDLEIEKAVEKADAVIVLLSKNAVAKEGYIQKELRRVLDIALEKPEETIFVIPLRLEDCEIPRRLRARQYVDYFPPERREQMVQRLLQSLKLRFGQLHPNKEVLYKTSASVAPAPGNISTRWMQLLSAKAGGSVDPLGTIPLIIYFALAALYVLTSASSINLLMTGIFSILAGIFLLLRRQLPSGWIFKISLILFVIIHSSNHFSVTPASEVLEGIAALVCCASALMTARVAKKPVLYSSISLALFLFYMGAKEILNSYDIYSYLSIGPIGFLAVIVVVLNVMDL